MNNFLIILMTLFIGLSAVNCDFYSSVVSVENLLVTEKAHLINLEDYLRTNSDNLVYQSYFKKVLLEHERAGPKPEDYFKNPINIFLLIKRMIIDWKLITDMKPVLDKIEPSGVMYDDYDIFSEVPFLSTEYDDEQITETPFFPELSDLSGAAMGIARLQKFYLIKPKDVAKGILDGTYYGTKMTADDCFRLGEELYHIKEYDLSLEWFKESINLSNENDANDDTQLTKINVTETFHYMSMAAFHLDDFKLAELYTDILLELEPENNVFKLNKDFIGEKIIKERKAKFKNNRNLTTISASHNESNIQERYERICRNEIQPTAKQLNPLRCRYVTNQVDFLRIAPLKLEEYNLDPFVGVYHQAIYDNEINEVISNSRPFLVKSRIGNFIYDNVTYSEKRISYSWWLKDFKYEDRINQRFEDMLGLNLQSAELLQIANYGIGGHFEPHWDFVDGHWGENGNRIATSMFYLSDVEKGGATAFVNLNISIYPEKGSLVFWYNMHKSLKFDYRTLHAACPVLVGSKWVGNKWFHEFGQEFFRPCGLKDDGDI